MGWHGWYMGWMWIFWIALIVLVVWFVVRAAGSTTTPSQHRESAEEILKRRYASGEISHEDYQRMLNEIRH